MTETTSTYATRPDVAQEAADWHARLRGAPLSELEQARFRAWLSGNPARRQEFDELSELWDRLDDVAQSPEVLAIQRQIRKRGGRHVASRRAVLGWALAAGVAGVAGFLGWQNMVGPLTFSTGVGEYRTVPLADGSVMELNTQSEVEVRFTDGERIMKLVKGQASFEVAKDPIRPFIVRVGGGEVLALGTVFDVYQREADVLVTLIEGRVAVVPAGTGGLSKRNAPSALEQIDADAIILTAGQQVAFGEVGRAPVRSAANLEQASAWRHRKLDFRETRLATAIAEANRHSRLKIELRATELADARISGVFQAGRNDALASALQAFFDLDVEQRGEDLIVLTRKTR